MQPTPCIHGDGQTLCPDCQREYDEDPTAWEEWGHHPRGIANAKALDDEMREEAVRLAALPFVETPEDVPL